MDKDNIKLKEMAKEEGERMQRILDHLDQRTPKPQYKYLQEYSDAVDHPAHYNSHPSGIECIEIARHYDFCIGNAIKYLWRCGLKHEQGMTDREKEIEDLKKAAWYIQDRIKELEGEQ